MFWLTQTFLMFCIDWSFPLTCSADWRGRNQSQWTGESIESQLCQSRKMEANHKKAILGLAVPHTHLSQPNWCLSFSRLAWQCLFCFSYAHWIPHSSSFLLARCKRVVELAREYDLLVVCDDVYNSLYFPDSFKDGHPPKRLFAYDDRWLVKLECKQIHFLNWGEWTDA